MGVVCMVGVCCGCGVVSACVSACAEAIPEPALLGGDKEGGGGSAVCVVTTCRGLTWCCLCVVC